MDPTEALRVTREELEREAVGQVPPITEEGPVIESNIVSMEEALAQTRQQFGEDAQVTNSVIQREAIKENPYIHAQAVERAKETGMPVGITKVAKDDLDHQERMDKLNKTRQAMQNWKADPDNAAISHDDDGPLEYISNLWDET